VSAPELPNVSARRGFRLRARPRADRGSSSEVGARVPEAARVGAPRLSVYASATIAATLAFIGLTCWWLTQDRSIPIYDAGDHLETALVFHQMLASGNLLGPFEFESPYPPFALMIGALSVFVGGVRLAAPILGENLVFVPILTLGCYQTGRLLFGPKAGMLAAICVLGSDLLIAQFHVFMLDAPEAAVVALSIWLILACEDFSRVGVAGAAGLVAGVGLVTKVQYPPFVMGIVLMALLRGGWRNWRGLLAFAAAALIVGVPWYVEHLAQFSTFLEVSTANPIVVPGDVPPTLSLASFAWYFWNILNSQLLAPLFVLLCVGAVWMVVTLGRGRREAFSARRPAAADRQAIGARLEFFVGAFVAWLFITLTPSHDIRYGIPLLPYVAVIATGWIVYMRRAVRWAAIAVLALGVIANTLGTTFGVGKTVQLTLMHPPPVGEEAADVVTLYSTAGFLVAGPSRDGDVPDLLAALKREGVVLVAWSANQSTAPDFDTEGLLPLTRIAGLSRTVTNVPEFGHSSNVATLIHLPITVHSPPACTRLSDGTGVWVVRYDTAAGKLAYYCPTRHPRFYDAGAIS
jgi:4-amino-4-deoxy-L-arabinose transferase-like glycosyltransferase